MTFSRFISVALAIGLSMTLCRCSKPGGPGADSVLFSATPLHTVDSHVVTTRGEWTERRFAVQTCLRDKASLKPLTDEPFEIDGPDKPIPVRTNGEGCLRWDETFTYSSMASEVFIELPRRVRSKGNYSNSEPLLLQLAFSPWREREPIIDIRDQKVSPLVPSTGLAPALAGRLPETRGVPAPAAVKLKTFELKLVGRRDRIDEALVLRPFREYRLVIHSPMALRHTLDRGPQDFPLRPNQRYRVRLVVTPELAADISGPPLEAVPLLNGFETEQVSDANGIISFVFPITNKLSDEYLVKSRVVIAVEVTLLGDTCLGSAQSLMEINGLGTKTDIPGSVLIANSPQVAQIFAARAVVPSDPRAEDYGTSGALVYNFDPAPSKPPFETLFPTKKIPEGMRLVDDSAEKIRDLEKLGITPAQLKLFFQNKHYLSYARGAHLLIRFCESGAGFPVALAAECRRDPYSFLSLNSAEFVDKVKNPVQDAVRSESIDLKADFYTVSGEIFRRTLSGVSDTRSDEFSSTTRSGSGEQGGRAWRRGTGLEAEFGFKAFGDGGTGKIFASGEDIAGTTWMRSQETTSGTVWRRVEYETVELGDSHEQRDRLTVSAGEKKRVEIHHYRFKADLRVCILINPHDDMDALKRVPAHLVCTRLEDQDRDENWYSMVDADLPPDPSLWKVVWTKVMRSEAVYRWFKEHLKDTVRQFAIRERRPLRQSGTLNDAETTRALIANTQESGTFPGLLVFHWGPPKPPLPGPLKWSEAQMTDFKDSCTPSAETSARARDFTGIDARKCAQFYCECLVGILARRFTHDDFMNRTDACFEDLKKDKSIDRCQHLAVWKTKE